MAKNNTLRKRVIGGLMSAALLITALPPLTAGAASVWNGSKATGFSGGKGTAASPYLIGTAAELSYFAEAINTDFYNKYVDKYFKLTADITLNNTSNWEKWGADVAPANAWKPIGSHNESGNDDDDCCFRGVFDGAGHTISGVYIYEKDEYDPSNTQERGIQGLFGYNLGTIKNLNVAKSYVHAISCAGAICGTNGDEDLLTFGTILNCTNAARVEGEYQSGGICGINDMGTIRGCSNSGTMTSKMCAGGICGAGEGTILNCKNNGTIESTQEMSGGIAGCSTGLVISCSNSGAVTAPENAGGISGVSSGIDAEVRNCFNTGVISGEKFVGGISGDHSTDMRGCYNTGAISGNTYVGGVCGRNQYNLVSNSYNAGSVTGTDYVGGVIGSNDYAYAELESCFNVGSVKADGTHTGGVTGMNKGEMTNCYYDSTVCGKNKANEANDVSTAMTTDKMTGEAGVTNMKLNQRIWAGYPTTATSSFYPQLRYAICDPMCPSDFSLATSTLAAPANLRQLYGNCISWSGVKNAVNYEISINGNIVTTSKNGFYCFQSLTPGTGYTIGVRALTADGSVSKTAEVKLTATTMLGAPTGLSRSATTLSWKKVTGAKKYRVWVIDAETDKFVYSNASVTATSFAYNTLDELKAGKTYSLRVCAIDANGNYGKSVSTKRFTVGTKPQLKRVGNNGVAWSAVAGASSYQIFINGSQFATTVNPEYLFETLTAGQKYTIGVKALCANGTESAMATITLTGTSMLALPTGVNRSGSTLRWNAVTGAQKYCVWVIDPETGKCLSKNAKITDTSYTFKTLKAGQQYQLRLCAIDANGNYGKTFQISTFTL